MYAWRQMSEAERRSVLDQRRKLERPWHQPPHFLEGTETRFLITAACYEHRPVIGRSADRMGWFEGALRETCDAHCRNTHAWCVLPNHYHLLVDTERIPDLLKALGRLHGSTSRSWNLADQTKGRKVWFRAVERFMRSERHFWATLNYVHHNPVKHGYTQKWQDWPFGSAADFLECFGRDYVERLWHAYPISRYGSRWDP